MALYKHACLPFNTLCQHLYVLFSPPKEVDFTQPEINREHCKLSQHIYTLCTHSKFCFSTFGELPQYLRPIKLTLQSELEKCITLNHPKHSFGKQFETCRVFFLAVHITMLLAAASWKQINQVSFVYSSIHWNHSGMWNLFDWVNIEEWFMFFHLCMTHYEK